MNAVTQPYELMAEHLAQEAVDHYHELHRENPGVLLKFLTGILQEAIHNGIEIGLSIAEVFDPAGPAELSEAYVAGYSLGKSEIKE